MKCTDCDGTGYQNIIGHPGALGRCESCEKLTRAAIRRAAEIIVAGCATAENKRNEDFIAEAESIIRREFEGLVVTRI